MNSKDFPCVNCGFSDHLNEAEYCQNCGMELRNFCPNEDCEANEIEDLDYASLPWDAKFCPYCGTKTTYFEYLSKNDHNDNNN